MAVREVDVTPRLPIEGVAYRPDDSVTSLVQQGGWSCTTVGDLVRQAATVDPDGTAVVSGEQRLSWAELDRRSDRLAGGLLDLGIAPANRVLLQLATNAETVVTLLALFKAGIVPVCAVPQYRDYEMSALCERSGAVAHIVAATDDLIALGQRLQERHPSLRHLLVSAPCSAGIAVTDLEASAQIATGPANATDAPGAGDVVAFQLSGGTTGVPKIIPRFHGEYVAYCQSFAERIALTSADRFLWSLPINHNAGMILVLVPCLLTRATIVLLERFDPATFLSTIATERVTVTGSIGPIAPRLLEMDVSGHDLSSVRYFLTLNRAADLERHLRVPVGNVFGITEGLLMASHPEDDTERRHHTVGAPVSPLDRVIVARPGAGGTVPAGDLGELCFAGPSTLTSYFRDEEATAGAFTGDGFFRTGDVVREHVIDGTSCFSFEGRIKENIDRGGEKFGTEEIENLLATHEGVLEARVIGMPDPLLGERVCAFVIPRAGRDCPDAATLGAFLLSCGLAKFKVPERVEAIEEFPVTSVGKLDRAALRQRISDLLTRERGDVR